MKDSESLQILSFKLLSLKAKKEANNYRYHTTQVRLATMNLVLLQWTESPKSWRHRNYSMSQLMLCFSNLKPFVPLMVVPDWQICLISCLPFQFCSDWARCSFWIFSITLETIATKGGQKHRGTKLMRTFHYLLKVFWNSFFSLIYYGHFKIMKNNCRLT